MAHRLMSLGGVPDDEADALRARLSEARIEFHETRPGLMGLLPGAIWIPRDEQWPDALNLFNAFQALRRETAREEHARALREGRVPGFLAQLREEPVRVVATLLGIAFLVGLSLLPFFLLRG